MAPGSRLPLLILAVSAAQAQPSSQQTGYQLIFYEESACSSVAGGAQTGGAAAADVAQLRLCGPHGAGRAVQRRGEDQVLQGAKQASAQTHNLLRRAERSHHPGSAQRGPVALLSPFTEVSRPPAPPCPASRPAGSTRPS